MQNMNLHKDLSYNILRDISKHISARGSSLHRLTNDEKASSLACVLHLETYFPESRARV